MIRTEPGLGRKHLSWASPKKASLPTPHHSPCTETNSDTHIQLPHFIGTKKEADPTAQAHPPGVSRLQHLVQHEYIINTGNRVGEWEKVPHRGRIPEALLVLELRHILYWHSPLTDEEGGGGLDIHFSVRKGDVPLCKQERDCMEGNSFSYIWKSRFQLADGYGREKGKFISHIRNGCGRKVSLCRQRKCFWDDQSTWVSVRRPFYSQVTLGRD